MCVCVCVRVHFFFFFTEKIRLHFVYLINQIYFQQWKIPTYIDYKHKVQFMKLIFNIMLIINIIINLIFSL